MKMHFSRLLSAFLVLVIIASLSRFPAVNGTGLETIGAILGVLPMSEILAGGGLIALKLAVGARLLALLGLIKLPSQTVLNSTTTTTAVPTTTPTTIESTSTLNPVTRVSFIDSLAQRNSSQPYYRLSSLLRYFGYGGENKTTTNSTAAAPTVVKPEAAQDGFAYFPIPGIRIGYDNDTKKYSLVQSSNFYPQAMLPPNFADYTGYKGHFPVSSNGSNMISLQDLINTGKNGTYLMYPFLPVNATSGSFNESGFSPISNMSQLAVFGPNKSLMPFPSNGSQLDFTGYGPTQQQDTTESEVTSSQATHTSPIDQSWSPGTQPPQPSTPSPMDLVNSTFGSSSASSSTPPPRMSRKTRRAKRSTKELIPYFFDVIYGLDENKCFAKMVCEIGANSTEYGTYGQHVARLFNHLDPLQFNISNVDFYMANYKLGQNRGICDESGSCQQNMTQVVSFMNKG